MKQGIKESTDIKYSRYNVRFINFWADLFSRQNEEIIKKERSLQHVASEKLPELTTEGISREMLESLGCFKTNLG